MFGLSLFRRRSDIGYVESQMNGSLAEQFPKPEHPIWYKSFSDLLMAFSKTASGIKVSPQVAETHSAVWSCQSLIAETIATLPRRFMLDTSSKGDRSRTVEARLHPFHRCFTAKPNPLMSATTYHAMMIRWLVGWGSAFAIMVNDSSNRTAELYPIHPSRVPREKVELNADGSLTYWILPDPERPGQSPIPRPISSNDLLHICGVGSDDGLFGKGALIAGAESMGIAVASDRYAAQYFGNGVHRGLYVSSKDTLSTEQYSRMTRDWIQKGGLKNAHKPVILEGGAKIQSAYVPAAQTQLLESRQFNVEDISRFFKTPSGMITGKPSPEDVENFLTFCLGPWIGIYCAAYDDQALGRKETRKYFTKIDPIGILMANLDRRSKYNREMWSIGDRTINEIRIDDGLDPIGPDGDIRWVPSNTITIDHAKALVAKTEAETEAAKAGAKAAADKSDPAKPNDNTLDSPSNNPSGDGTSKPTTKIVSSVFALLEDHSKVPVESQVVISPDSDLVARRIVRDEEFALCLLAKERPSQFPDLARKYYEDAFTADVEDDLILFSGNSLGDSTKASLRELASQRLASLDDLYDSGIQDFPGKLAFRLAAERPERFEALRSILAGAEVSAPV